jgi:hypothetical protein
MSQSQFYTTYNSARKKTNSILQIRNKTNSQELVLRKIRNSANVCKVTDSQELTPWKIVCMCGCYNC